MILAVLGIVSVAVILVLIAAGLIRGEREAIMVRSSHSSNVAGTRVAYVLFERLGIRVSRSEHPLLDHMLEGCDTVLLIDPILPLGEGEVSGLKSWVRRGGVLVCATFWPHLLEELCGIEVRDRFASDGARDEPRGVPEEVQAQALARDVETVYSATAATLHSRGKALRMEELFSDAAGLRIAAAETGRGCVIVLADSSFLCNGSIGKGDNAVLAANLVAYARALSAGRRIVFDEYHYGFGTRETGRRVMVSMLFRTRPGWAVLSLTAAGLLFLVYRGRRFGTRRAPARTRRRSKLEYVYSVGATYRSAGAHTVTFRLVFQWFKRKIARVVGLPETASSGEIAGRLAQRTGRPAGGYAAVLRRCEGACAAPVLSGRRAAALVNQLAVMESEVFDGNPHRE